MDNQVYQDCLDRGKSVDYCVGLALQSDLNKINEDNSSKNQQYLKDTYYRRNLQYGLSTLGFAGGLYYAYKKHKHFWGYVGFGLLFSIGAGAVGYFVGSIIDKPNTSE